MMNTRNYELNYTIGYITEKDGGISIDRQGRKPSTGFMVGVRGCSSVREMTAMDLRANEYYGTWKDEEDGGKVYYDISENIQDKEEALRIAKERGELAIFDLETFESIYIA